MSAVTLPTTVYDLLVLKGLLQAGMNHAYRQGDEANENAYHQWLERVNAVLKDASGWDAPLDEGKV